MKFIVTALALLLAQIPKHNPDGIWQSETGSQFEFHLTGSDLRVQIVPGTNPRFVKYEVQLKNQEEVNTYKGSGYFVAKMQGGKECRFDTEWLIVVAAPDRTLGSISNIIADSATCEIREKNQVTLDLKKK